MFDASKVLSASSIKATEKPKNATLIFGAPKSGKTYAVGMLSNHTKVLWFDAENGNKTLLADAHAKDFNLDNIILQRVVDTPRSCNAYLVMNSLLAGKDTTICAKHGLRKCPACPPEDMVTYNLNDIPDDVIVVIDSFTAIAASRINHISASIPAGTEGVKKFAYDHWTALNNTINDWGLFLQYPPCNIVVIGHEAPIEHTNGVVKLSPIAGTKVNSSSFGRYFDNLGHAVSKAGNFYIDFEPKKLTGSVDGGSRTSLTRLASKEDMKKLLEY